MSDRLDIVRLIDSKVSATRRTVARSKQLAEAAKDDLTTHEEWLAGHRRLAQEESERHRRRLSRTRRAEARKHFALWLLLLVPSACAAMFRAGGAGLAALGETFYFGCCWIGRTAYGGGRWLVRLIAGSIAWFRRWGGSRLTGTCLCGIHGTVMCPSGTTCPTPPTSRSGARGKCRAGSGAGLRRSAVVGSP